MRTREQHLQFCKEQAWKQYEYDMSGAEYSNPDTAIINACASMLSDLSKHPDTQKQGEACAILVFIVKDYESMKRFINGFN